MNEQNYINHYVEILTSTMTEAVIRNVSLQAQTKVINEVVENQSKQLDDLNNTINNLKDEINSLKNQNSDFNNMKNAYDSAQNQLSHLDTFRNELIKEREEHQQTKKDYETKIADLNQKIEKLKPTPTKKTKVAPVQTPIIEKLIESNTVIKDGGTF